MGLTKDDSQILPVTKKKPWKKNLYENQDYPDNFTDASFLEELKKNLHVRKVTFKEACFGASLLTQQLCIVVIFACSFIYLYNEWISPTYMNVCTSCFSFIAYCILFYGNYNLLSTCGNVACYIGCSYLLSPVLKTLTESIDTDTIFSTSVCMMVIHLIFFDYGVPALIVSSSLSLNAAIFGAVCLASRLPSSASVAAFINVTVQFFALVPLLLTKIGSSLFVLISLIIAATMTLHSVSFIMTLFFLITISFINLICPYLFVKWHSYKENIYGPWDEAVISLPSTRHNSLCRENCNTTD